MDAPGGTIAHAELEIGDPRLMLSDPFPQPQVQPPNMSAAPRERSSSTWRTSTRFQRAVDAGATVTMALEDMFWGDRFGTVTDPFGHVWQIASHVEDLTPEEIKERSKTAMAAMAN